MTFLSFLSHLVFASVLFGIATSLTWLMLSRVRIMDIPNARSSHHAPIPRGGGVAIVVTFLLGVVVIDLLGDKTPLSQQYFWAFLGSALLIAVVSFLDDITDQGFLVKLATQFLAALFVVASGIVLDQFSVPFVGNLQLPWLGTILTIFWVVGLTNSYNFMDGIDGLAATTAVIASAFFAYITFRHDSLFIYITSYTVMAGAGGFLVFNRPPARIFLGDVGSAFLGFIFAVMAIVAARYDHSHTSFLVVPLLLLHFLFDTTATLCRRIVARENITQAHRTHAYQLLVRMGLSHGRVTLIYAVLGVLQGIAAIVMVEIGGEARLWVFAPFLLAYTVAYLIIWGQTRINTYN